MFGAGVCHAVLMAEGQLSERERQDRKMIVATVFGKIISIFIIMIVGVICCKMGIIDDYTKQRLSRLSTLVVNPILIFTSFQMEYDSELLKKMGLLFVLAVISYLISIMIGHFLLHEREGYDLSIEKFAVTYDNCGFIGVPFGYALFGNIGVIYATVFVAVFHIFCWTHGIMLLDKGGFQLKKLINPCLIAVIAGMVFFIFQIRLPESIDFAMGAMTITMAIMYERDDHYATELFTVTTLLSILTMPLCMLIAG